MPGHSLDRLYHQAARWEATWGEKVKRWSTFDGCYVPTCYPNGLPGSIPERAYIREAPRKR